MDNVGGPLIDAGKGLLMIPDRLLFIMELVGGSVALAIVLWAVSCVVRAFKGKQ